MLDLLVYPLIVGVVGGLVLYVTNLWGSAWLDDLDAEECDGRAVLVTRLRQQGSARERYQNRLSVFLVWLDRFFEEGKVIERAGNGSAVSAVRCRITASSYDRCLGLAFTYPVVFASLNWLASGEAGALGSFLGLVEIEGVVGFIVRLFWFGIFVFMILYVKKKSGNIYFSLQV